jgi:hypothetical protein
MHISNKIIEIKARKTEINDDEDDGDRRSSTWHK